MAEIYRLQDRSAASQPRDEEASAQCNPAEVHAFTGLNFAEMRRIMHKYGFCTEGIPGAGERMAETRAE